ncbi:MAG TPA: VOC family protein [Blastocatellia bacterium]|nr:VOC family protein [Blastocatellia bacterium]
MKEVTTYLTFNGDCGPAMKFYQQAVGGDLVLLPFSESPMDVPKEAKDRVLHAKLAKNGRTILMASDTMPNDPVHQGANFSISIDCESVEEIDKLFAALGANGKVTMPLQETFWAPRFGMLTDQFGVNWMFNLEKKS